MPGLPWTNLALHPEDYYDTTQYKFKFPLQMIEEMNHIQVVTVNDELRALQPGFRFFKSDEIVARVRERVRAETESNTAGDEMSDIDGGDVEMAIGTLIGR